MEPKIFSSLNEVNHSLCNSVQQLSAKKNHLVLYKCVIEYCIKVLTGILVGNLRRIADASSFLQPGKRIVLIFFTKKKSTYES